MFQQLQSNGWIYKKDDQWHLTKEGKTVGGDIKYNPKFGEYVVWPINLDLSKKLSSDETLNSTKIGQEFCLTAQRINAILSELGWIEKSNIGGWKLTRYGKRNGGFEMEAQNGSPYVIWDVKILKNKSFLDSIDATTGKATMIPLSLKNPKVKLMIFEKCTMLNIGHKMGIGFVVELRL